MCTGVGKEWCSSDDPYAGYDGAFKCLAHGVGDIAWVRDNTVSEMVKSGGFSADVCINKLFPCIKLKIGDLLSHINFPN